MAKNKGDLADPLPNEKPPKHDDEILLASFKEEPETVPAPCETEPVPDETEGPEYPAIETHTETQSLKCFLTEAELKAAGEAMARADGERSEAESTLKSVQAQYKAKIASAEAAVSMEAQKIRNGYEFRHVDVEVRLDHALGTVQSIRKDTSEVIAERPMTDYERQRKIRFT